MAVVRLTTAAGAWGPASLEDLRDFGRVTLPDEDHVLQRLLEAATAEVERYSGLVLVPGTFRVSFDAWARRLEVPIGPVTAVDAVRYQLADGTATVLTSTAYVADVASAPARVSFVECWRPASALRATGGIEVDVTAGYATPYVVPADIKQHVITVALLMFEHRDDPEALDRVRRYASSGGSAFEVVTL